MAITTFDLKRAAFCSELDEIQEVALNNRGLIDLGSLGEAINLREVNVSFNKLPQLSGLSALRCLHTLNVSHNALTTLKGLSSLTSLTQLNAGYNKLSSIGPLEGLTGLRDLYLQHNALPQPFVLQPLSSLVSLARLVVSPNPLAARLGDPATSRLLLLRLCGCRLEVLDAAECSEEERAQASALGADDDDAGDGSGGARDARRDPALSLFRPPSAGSCARVPNDLTGLIARMGSSPSPSSPSPSSPHDSPGPRPPRHPHPPGPSGTSNRGRPGGSDNTLPSAPGRLPRGGGARAGARSASPAERSGSDGGGSPYGQGGEVTRRASVSSLLEDAQSSLDALDVTARRRSSGGPSHGRRSAAAAGLVPRIKSIPEGSSFQAVLDALPKFANAKLGATYSGREGAAPKHAPPPPPPPDATLVDYECRYPKYAQRAVTVKRDGSVCSYWPTGELAVTVDADHGATGGATPGATPYRMVAMYRNNAGTLAASFDSVTGGFVQFPGGGVALIAGEAGGTVYCPDGGISAKWSYSDSDAPPFVDLQLDAHMGVRFVMETRALHLYLSCDGLRYRFVCGRNAPGATWVVPGAWGQRSGSAPATAPAAPLRAEAAAGSKEQRGGAGGRGAAGLAAGAAGSGAAGGSGGGGDGDGGVDPAWPSAAAAAGGPTTIAEAVAAAAAAASSGSSAIERAMALMSGGQAPKAQQAQQARVGGGGGAGAGSGDAADAGAVVEVEPSSSSSGGGGGGGGSPGFAALFVLRNPYVFAAISIAVIIPQNSAVTSLNSLVLIFYDSGLFMNFAEAVYCVRLISWVSIACTLISFAIFA
ncbi:hypothetical protein FOA52_012085 [Chlamydomonas sp. UWO 241]|nr:hypothetical protein FOA52_012085 [Chlamydomonas sp. UWO 241]